MISNSIQKDSYFEIKATILSLINRVKLANPEKGGYLEAHFIFNDNDMTFVYDGAEIVLEDVLNNAQIVEVSPYFPANG